MYKITLTKHLFSLTPTNHRVNRYTHKRSPKCPLCDADEENNMHLLLCTHPDRIKWKNSTLKSIQEFCDKLDTHPILEEILLTGLKAWFLNEVIDLDEFDSKYHQLILQQNDIGWQQIFSGRMSKLWAHHQSLYYDNDDETTSGDTWITKISIHAFKCWKSMWKDRCDTQHGADHTAKERIRRNRAIAEMRVLYAAKEVVPTALLNKYYPPLRLQLKQPTNIIEDWINLRGPHIRKNVTRAAKRRKHKQRALWDSRSHPNGTFYSQ